MFINDKFKKDATFTNILTCSSNDSIDELCEYLLSHKIKYIPVDSYNRRNERTKTVMAFAQTRSKSKLIDSFLDNSETKYLRQILH
jgi:CBS-domain-containing membrane protein